MVLGLYALVFAAKMATEVESSQINFKTSYYAALALAQGRDPYDSEVLSELSGRHLVLPYVYPPATLWLFLPLTRFDYPAAHRIFLAAKLVALGILLWIWQQRMIRPAFGGDGSDALFLLVCLLGFNYAICWDLQSGNMNLFTEMMLWLGFCLLMHGSLGGFASCVALAAWFKLTPIGFLGLLSFEEDRSRWRAMALGIAVFALLQGVSLLVYPDLMHEWLENLGRIRGLSHGGAGDEARELAAAPSSRLLLTTLLAAFQSKSGLTLPATTETAVYAGLVLAVAATTVWALWRNRGQPLQLRRLDAVVAACLAYMLIMPRLLLYQYVLVLFPAYYVARRMERVPGATVLVLLMLISVESTRPPGFQFLVLHLSPFYPLMVVLVLWAIHIARVSGYALTQNRWHISEERERSQDRL